MRIPLSWYLFLGAALFCIGLYGALSAPQCHRHPDGH